MIAMKLAGPGAVVAKAAQHGAIGTPGDHPLEVARIVHEHERLIRIRPEADIAHRSGALGGRLVNDIFHERTVLLEDLQAVVQTIADVDEPLSRDAHAMRDPELLCGRRSWLVRSDLFIG